MLVNVSRDETFTGHFPTVKCFPSQDCFVLWSLFKGHLCSPSEKTSIFFFCYHLWPDVAVKAFNFYRNSEHHSNLPFFNSTIKAIYMYAHAYEILMAGFHNNSIFEVMSARHQNSYHERCAFTPLRVYKPRWSVARAFLPRRYLKFNFWFTENFIF